MDVLKAVLKDVLKAVLMIIKKTDPFGSVELWYFTSPRGANHEFNFHPPYQACGPLHGGYYGVMSKIDRRGNVLKKGNLVGVTNRAVARQIAKKWNKRNSYG